MPISMLNKSCLLSVILLSARAAYAQSTPALPTVVSTTDLGFATHRSDIFERDGGFSFTVNGTSFWIFDDTGTESISPSGVKTLTSFNSNTAAATTQTSGVNGVDLSYNYTDGSGKLIQFVPYSSDENTYNSAHFPDASGNCAAGSYCGSAYAIWPWGVVYDPVSQQAFISFSSFLRGGKVPSSEEGHGIAVGTMGTEPVDGIDWPVMTRPAQGYDPARPTLLWSATDIPFSGTAYTKDGYYYQFGETSANDPGCWKDWCVQDYSEHLAKVKVADVLDRSKWLFLTQEGTWSSSQSDLATLFVSTASNFVSIYHNNYLGEYMAVYLKELDTRAYFRVSKTLEGPWSDEALLFTGEKPTTGLDYGLRAHAALSPDDGKTMIFHYAEDTSTGVELPVEEVVFAKP